MLRNRFDSDIFSIRCEQREESVKKELQCIAPDHCYTCKSLTPGTQYSTNGNTIKADCSQLNDSCPKNIEECPKHKALPKMCLDCEYLDCHAEEINQKTIKHCEAEKQKEFIRQSLVINKVIFS